MLCELLANFLENDLHTVEIAQSAQQALEKFKVGTFDLVITDHIMTEMNGEQLAAALKARDAAVPVILLTGFGEIWRAENERLSAVDAVVAKPFSRSGLRQAMMQVVRATSSEEHKEQHPV